MPIAWEPLLLFPLLVMAIPVTILIGQRWRSGPLISLSAGATLGVVIELALTWATFSTNGEPAESTIGVLSLLGGAILLLGALALTFADAMRERRRIWAIILCALVYASFVGMLGFVLEPVMYCAYALPLACAPPYLGRLFLFAALSLAGPLVALLYALLAQGRAAPAPDRELEQPEGLTISRLTAEEV